MARKPKLDSSDDILIKNSTMKPGDKPSEKLLSHEEWMLGRERRRVVKGTIDPAGLT